MGQMQVVRSYRQDLLLTAGLVDTIFDPANANINIILTNNNLKATRGAASSGSWAIGKSNNAALSGKYYVELTLNDLSGATGTEPLGFGIANANESTATGNYLGDSADSAGFYFNNSSYYRNLTNIATGVGASGSAGNVMACFIDLDNKVLSAYNISAGLQNNSALDLVPLNPGPYRFGIALSRTNAAGTGNFGASTFSGTVPNDFASGWGKNTPSVACQWSTAWLYKNFVSGAFNHIITNNAAIPNSEHYRAHATTHKTSGKWYCEALINQAVGSGRTIIGVSVPGAPLNQNVANDIHAVGYANNGQVYVAGAGPVTTIMTFTTNDTVSMAVDLDNNRIWFRVGAGNWNNDASANPATNTNGIDISGIRVAGYRYAATWSCQPGTSNPGQATFNWGQSSFAQSVPSGFSGWGNS